MLQGCPVRILAAHAGDVKCVADENSVTPGGAWLCSGRPDDLFIRGEQPEPAKRHGRHTDCDSGHSARSISAAWQQTQYFGTKLVRSAVRDRRVLGEHSLKVWG